MPDELQRSVELLERLLGDPQLRRRFRTDAATVLTEAGLPELAAGLGHGGRALMTLEMRESRSSLAGVMVAAAAEGVDLAQFAEHAAPALAHDADAAVHHLMQHPHRPGPGAGARRGPAAAGQAELRAPSRDPDSGAARAQGGAHPRQGALPDTRTGGTDGGGPQPEAASATQAATAPGALSGRAAGHRARGRRWAPRRRQPARHRVGRPRAISPPTTSPRAQRPAPEAPDPADAGPAYPGDQATPQQFAAWMGARAEKAGLPPELPVMAALTESGLRNLSYGDRDSVGFFQMRVGIWDQGAYAGYPSNPELQVQWFIDHAVAVKAQYPELANNPNSWGEWVADVEQPAEQYRFRYQLQLSTAQALLHGADLSSGAPAPAAAPAPPPVPVGQAALKVAMHFTGGGAVGGQPRRRAHVGGAGPVRLRAPGRAGAQSGGPAVRRRDPGLRAAPQARRRGVLRRARRLRRPRRALRRQRPLRHCRLHGRRGQARLDRRPAVRGPLRRRPALHRGGAQRPGHYARPLPTIKQ